MSTEPAKDEAKQGEQKKIERLTQLKDISTLLRDVLLTLIVASCMLKPGIIKNFLKDSGLSKLGVFGVTVELQEEKEKIAEAQKKITAEVVTAAPIASDEAPPEAKKAVDPEFKETILSAERVAPQILPTAGWIFLGHVDQGKTNWTDKASATTTAKWPIAEETVLTVRDDVYIRALTDDKSHSNAKVVSVAKIGDKLKVVEVQFSSAKVGGFYVWAKVAILNS